MPDPIDKKENQNTKRKEVSAEWIFLFNRVALTKKSFSVSKFPIWKKYERNYMNVHFILIRRGPTYELSYKTAKMNIQNEN